MEVQATTEMNSLEHLTAALSPEKEESANTKTGRLILPTLRNKNLRSNPEDTIKYINIGMMETPEG